MNDDITPQEAKSAPPQNTTLFVFVFLIPIITTVAYGGTNMWALVFLAPFYAVLGGVWIIRSWRQGTFELNVDVILLPIVCLIALGIIQLLPLGGSPLPPDLLDMEASRAITTDPFATRIFIVRLIGYAIFLAAALTFINTEARYRRTVTLLVICGGALAFAGILQKLASPDAIWGVRKHTAAIPFGPYVNQHHFASLMVMLSGPAIAHLLGNGVKGQTKTLIGIAALIMGIAVPLTSSRGGIISYAVMLVVASFAFFTSAAVPDSRRRSWLPAFAGIASLLVLIFGAVIFLGGADNLLRGIGFENTSDDITSGRLGFWAAAVKIFSANPLMGAGLDAFGNAYSVFDQASGQYRVEQAHNEYLQMLADGGVIGLVIVAAFVFLLARRAVERLRDPVNDFHRVTIVGAVAGIAGILTHSIFDFPLRTAGNGYFFLVVVALLAAAIPRSTSQRRHRVNER